MSPRAIRKICFTFWKDFGCLYLGPLTMCAVVWLYIIFDSPPGGFFVHCLVLEHHEHFALSILWETRSCVSHAQWSVSHGITCLMWCSLEDSLICSDPNFGSCETGHRRRLSSASTLSGMSLCRCRVSASHGDRPSPAPDFPALPKKVDWKLGNKEIRHNSSWWCLEEVCESRPPCRIPGFQLDFTGFLQSLHFSLSMNGFSLKSFSLDGPILFSSLSDIVGVCSRAQNLRGFHEWGSWGESPQSPFHEWRIACPLHFGYSQDKSREPALLVWRHVSIFPFYGYLLFCL